MPWRHRSPRATAIILAICLAALSAAIVAWGGRADITHTPFTLLRCVPSFIAGMGLYRVYREGWLKKWMTSDGTVAVIAIATIGLASFSGTDIVVIVALACLLLACAHNNGVVARMLAGRAPLFLGRISYSLYLIQLVSADAAVIAVKFWLAPHSGSNLEVGCLMFVLSFAFAIPLSRYIEYPMRDWLRGKVRLREAAAPNLA